jgi:hypothetical protein
VLAAAAAELTKLQTISRGLLVLCRNVVAALAFAALQHNVISRHKLISPILDRLFLGALRLSFLRGFARNRFTQRRKAPKGVSRKDRALFDHL